MTQPERSDTPTDPQRWMLTGMNYAQRNRCDGPDVPPRQSVEVMLVTEHEAEVKRLRARIEELTRYVGGD